MILQTLSRRKKIVISQNANCCKWPYKPYGFFVVKEINNVAVCLDIRKTASIPVMSQFCKMSCWDQILLHEDIQLAENIYFFIMLMFRMLSNFIQHRTVTYNYIVKINIISKQTDHPPSCHQCHNHRVHVWK